MATDVDTMEEIYSFEDKLTGPMEDAAKKVESFEKKLIAAKKALDDLQKADSKSSPMFKSLLDAGRSGMRYPTGYVGLGSNPGASFDAKAGRWRNAQGRFSTMPPIIAPPIVAPPVVPPPVVAPPVLTGGGGGGGGFLGGIGAFFSGIPAVGQAVGLVWDMFKGILGTIGSIIHAVFNWKSALAALGILKFMEVSGQFQAYRTSLERLLGSKEAGDRQYKRNEALAKLPGIGYEEAFQRFNQLYATGANPRMAERITEQFGNANALMGGGKEEFSNIMLAITQMLTKPELSGEEVNRQLSQYLPMLRTLMMKAFGSADTEKVAKMVSPQQFVSKILTELEQIPRAADGWKNQLENMDDIFKRVSISIGDALNKRLLPALTDAANWVDNLVGKGVVGDFMDRLFGMFDGKETKKLGGNIMSTVYGGLKLAQDSDSITGGSEGAFNKSIGNPLERLGGAFKFISEGADLGDKFKRIISLAGAAFMQVPTIIEGLSKAVNEFIEAINEFGLLMRSTMAALKMTPFGALLPSMDNINKLFPEIHPGQGFDGGKFVADAKRLYDQGMKPAEGGEDPSKDPTKGAFMMDMSKTAENTKQLVEIQKQTRDYMQTILGGGQVSQGTLSQTNLSKLTRGSSSARTRLYEALEAVFEEERGSSLMAMSRSNALRA